MDGDLQHHPKYLSKLFNVYTNNKRDIVVSSRSFKKRKNLSVIRFYTSKILIYIINFVLGYKVSDPMSGFLYLIKTYYEK